MQSKCYRDVELKIHSVKHFLCSVWGPSTCRLLLLLACFTTPFFSLEPPRQPAGRELSSSQPKTTATPPAPVGSSSGTELNGFVESTSRIGKGEDAPAASRPAIVITAMRGESEESNGESVTVTTATAATTTHQQKVVASNSTNCLTFLFYRRS